MKSNDSCINVCNRLLSGEISAVETYDKAIGSNPDTPVIGELIRIRAEHAEAVSRLSANIRDMGGKPDERSGAWGVVASAIEGTAVLFGRESTIQSLQKGEEIGRRGYEDALQDEDVMAGCKETIRRQLLPRTISHITTLGRMEQTV